MPMSWELEPGSTVESARADLLLSKRDSEPMLDSGAFHGQGDTLSILPGEWVLAAIRDIQCNRALRA